MSLVWEEEEPLLPLPLVELFPEDPDPKSFLRTRKLQDSSRCPVSARLPLRSRSTSSSSSSGVAFFP